MSIISHISWNFPWWNLSNFFSHSKLAIRLVIKWMIDAINQYKITKLFHRIWRVDAITHIPRCHMITFFFFQYDISPNTTWFSLFTTQHHVIFLFFFFFFELHYHKVYYTLIHHRVKRIWLLEFIWVLS